MRIADEMHSIRTSRGPIAAFVGNLRDYTNKIKIFDTLGGPRHRFYAYNSGVDGLIDRYACSSRLKVYKIRTCPLKLATKLGLGDEYIYYSVVVVSMPIVGCVGKRGAATREKRLNVAFLVSKDDQNYFAWNHNQLPTTVFSSVGQHYTDSAVRLKVPTNQVVGAIAVDPHYACSLERTMCSMHLRPYDVNRFSFKSLDWRPLNVETLASSQDLNRSMIDSRRQKRPGHFRRSGLAACDRLSRLLGRALELLVPGYTAFRGRKRILRVNDTVKLGKLRRCTDLWGETGLIETVESQHCVVQLVNGRLVRVHRDFIVCSGRTHGSQTHWPPRLKPTTDATRFVSHLRHYLASQAEQVPETRGWRRFKSTEEWRSLIDAIYTEAKVVRDFNRRYVIINVIVDMYGRWPVRVKRIGPHKEPTLLDPSSFGIL